MHDQEQKFAESMKHLGKITQCPDCGNNTIRERSLGPQHSCGDWNESLSFSCGIKIAYESNMRSIRTSVQCGHSKEYRARRAAVEAFKKEMFELAEKRGLDPKDVKKLRDTFQYWSASQW